MQLVKRGETYAVKYWGAAKKCTNTKSLGTADERTARVLAAQFAVERSDPGLVQLDEIEVSALVAKLYTDKGKDLPSKYVYKQTQNLVNEHLQGMTLGGFKLKQQEAFVKTLRESLADGTIQRVMATIKASVRYAYAHGTIPTTPFVMSVTSNKRRTTTFKESELKAILKANREGLARRYLVVAILTGARPQAIVELQKDQFDYEDELIYLLPQDREQNAKKKRPTLPMPKALLVESSKWGNGPIFPNTTTGGRLSSTRSIWNQLRPSFPKGTTPYTIRHTVATYLAREGVSHEQRSAWLGHVKPGSRTTQLYEHLEPGYLKSAADAMDRLWERLNNEQQSDESCGDTKSLRECIGECAVGG